MRAENLAVASSAGDQALPARLHGVLPMAGDIPTLLTEGHEDPPSWEQFEYLTHGVLELLGRERFTAEVSLTVRDLSTGRDLTISQPANVEIADVLQITEAQVAEVENTVFGAVAGVVSRLAMVAPSLWGDSALEIFTDARAATYTRDDILHALVGLCGDEAQANEVLTAASDSADPDVLRRRMGVTLADFNAALSRHFPSQPLVNNEVQHQEEFDLRVGRRRPELRDRARRTRLGRFQAGAIQYDWPHIRSLSFLRPDPTWARTRDVLGDDLIDALTDEQMLAELGPVPADQQVLQDWREVHAANGKPLRERLIRTRRAVEAWCEREKVVAPSVWAMDSFDGAIRERLDQIGALDFTTLAETDLAEWLARIDAWPDGMAPSTDPTVHGLTADELNAQESAEAKAKAVKARAAKQVQFQNHEIELDASMSALVSRVSDFLASEPASLNAAYRMTPIGVIGDRKGSLRRGGGDSRGSGRPFVNRLSTEQTNAVGLVGEMVAYHWLTRRDRGVVDESCWKSGNVQFVFEGLVGDDGLGFDFEVPRRDGSVMYEVKSTTGDAGMIELGETEVDCAREFSRTQRWRLLVVEHVFSTEPRVHMLPNPFHRNSRSLFRSVGNSVRFCFRLDA